LKNRTKGGKPEDNRDGGKNERKRVPKTPIEKREKGGGWERLKNQKKMHATISNRKRRKGE